LVRRRRIGFEQFAKDLLCDADWLQECVELLRLRPQLVFYGPPGTGKTYLARELARYLAGRAPETVGLVQFHPAYGYEDFVQGYRPRGQPGDGGQIAFDRVSGPLMRLARAAESNPEQPHFLIIDEINRGNLAKIFGELYILLEYRTRSSTCCTRPRTAAASPCRGICTSSAR
jgi:5-methylcytosine-specific restriction enzyme B